MLQNVFTIIQSFVILHTLLQYFDLLDSDALVVSGPIVHWPAIIDDMLISLISKHVKSPNFDFSD